MFGLCRALNRAGSSGISHLFHNMYLPGVNHWSRPFVHPGGDVVLHMAGAAVVVAVLALE